MPGRFFGLREAGTTVGTELIAGSVTFMTMAYIVFVNPGILAAAGIPREAAMVATCIAAGGVTLLMGLFANRPIALAPGMGLNAFLAFTIVGQMKFPWQVAMAVVLVEGALITVLVLTHVREQVMNAIPMGLKRAIAIGIGFFIAFLGLQSAGLVVHSPDTLVTFGHLTRPVMVSLTGLVLTAVLMLRRQKGAILIGILATTLLALALGLTRAPDRLLALPELAHFVTFGAALRPEALLAAVKPALWATLFAFLMTDFFDTMGSVVAIAGEGKFLDPQGRIPHLNRILLVDSLGALFGGVCGCSSVTTYIESASGVGEGGRTGLTSVFTALWFFLAVFLWPLVAVIPAAATAPALILVGLLLMGEIGHIDWHDFGEAFPAFLTIMTIPLTGSISRGIGFGVIASVLIRLFGGRRREIQPVMWLLALVFALDFWITR